MPLRASRACRRAIAVLSLLPAGLTAAATAAAVDVALLRDGTRRSGALSSCVGSSCRFGGETLRREELAWLGLAVASDAKPPLLSEARELVVLTDGSVQVGEIEGISLGELVVGGRSIERSAVRWVRFAAPPPVDGGGGLAGRDGVGKSGELPNDGGGRGADRTRGDDPEDPEPGSSEPEVPEPDGDRDDRSDDPPLDDGDETEEGDETERRPPGTRDPNPEPVARCPRERPLGGHVVHGYAVADRTFQRCSGEARLWFRLHTLAGDWPHVLLNIWQSDAIDYELTLHGCTDLPDPMGQVCTAPRRAASGRVVLGAVGQFGVDLLGAPGGPVSFDAMEPELSFLTLPDAIRHGLRTPLRCTHPGLEPSLGEWELPIIGAITGRDDADCERTRLGPCVTPTRCMAPTDPDVRRDCFTRPDRYAVIPFRGDETVRETTGSPPLHQIEVTRTYRWEVCCGCGERPTGPPPEIGPEDPCGDPTQQRDLLQVEVDTARELRRELSRRFARYESARHQAAQYRSDFTLVSNSCAGWEIAMTLTEALLGGVAGAEVPEGAQAFTTLLGWIEAILDQDPTVLLDATSALEFDLAGIEGFTPGDLWDAVSGVADVAGAAENAASVAGLAARIEECSHVPLVSGLVYDGAREHVRQLGLMVAEIPGIRGLTTRISQADTRALERWFAWHRACLEHAACSGGDPAACGPAPD